MNCPLCQDSNLALMYQIKDIPVFQNKVYATREGAKNAQIADVSLKLCHNCGFVFNSDFDVSVMLYNAQYQNEQAHSAYFRNYLDDLIGFLKSKHFHKKRIVEIGCGKGYFLEKLREYGFEAMGFDPAYEGDVPYIIRDFFTEKYSHLNADVIILRHTLEHIHNPLEFLHEIARAADYKGVIFIEVPSLEWILQHRAFWDIFYEHCNYFAVESLGSIFQKSEQGLLFSGQYMYLLADLQDLRTGAKPATSKMDHQFVNLTSHLKEYQQFVQNHQNMLIWGAGAKGATFVNLMDPHRKFITCAVDINPKKQHYYIAKTAHEIVSPESLNEHGGGNILVMNENYYEEIKRDVKTLNFNLYVLGVD